MMDTFRPTPSVDPAVVADWFSQLERCDTPLAWGMIAREWKDSAKFGVVSEKTDETTLSRSPLEHAASWLVKDHLPNWWTPEDCLWTPDWCPRALLFNRACRTGTILDVQGIIETFRIEKRGAAFVAACSRGNLEVAKFLNDRFHGEPLANPIECSIAVQYACYGVSVPVVHTVRWLCENSCLTPDQVKTTMRTTFRLSDPERQEQMRYYWGIKMGFLSDEAATPRGDVADTK